MPPLFLHDHNSKSDGSLFPFRKAFRPEYMFTSSQSLQTLPFSENICLSLIISNHNGFFQLRWTFAMFALLATRDFPIFYWMKAIDPPAFILFVVWDKIRIVAHGVPLIVCVCVVTALANDLSDANLDGRIHSLVRTSLPSVELIDYQLSCQFWTVL